MSWYGHNLEGDGEGLLGRVRNDFGVVHSGQTDINFVKVVLLPHFIILYGILLWNTIYFYNGT